MTTIELGRHDERTGCDRVGRDAPTPGDLTSRWRARMCLGTGFAMAVATTLDGPLPWPVVRAAVILVVCAAVGRAGPRIGARARSALGLVLGLAATVFGAGVGVPNLMKQPAGPVCVFGLITLAGGFAMSVDAIVGIVRGCRWWTKTVTVTSLAALAVVFGVPATFALVNSDVPPIPLGDRTPASVGLEFDEIVLTTDDDVDLDAWYVPSRNGAAVVLLAGAGSTRSDEVDRAAAVARHGYGVLLLDVRGHGGSGGEAMLLGWYGERDVRPAIDWLLDLTDIDDDRIGVVGMSMGGQQAVAAFGADHRIRAAVADGVVGRHTSELSASDPVDELMGRLMMIATAAMTSAPHPTPLRAAVQSAAPNRLLVIAGERVGLERDFAQELAEASPQSVEVWVAPDSGHTEGFDRHPAEWEQRVVGFLDTNLV
ncbi:MAG: alpha/beta hydrolase [Ilumatobacteraceae bacterium]